MAGVLAALVYQGVVDAPFLFDDRHTILFNPSIVPPWHLTAILFHNPARPVLNVSFAIDSALWGVSSFGFHVTSVILHIAVVGAFYGWCTRALSDAEHETRAKPEWAAFFAAALLAVHPVMSTAVLYVTARSELLAALGFFAALTFARRAIVTGRTASGGIAALFAALAIGSSSSAAALPLIILSYDAWVLRSDGWRRRARRVYAPAMLAISLALLVQASRVFGSNDFPPEGVAARYVAAGTVVAQYTRLLFFPSGQSLAHDTGVHAIFSGAGMLSVILLVIEVMLVAIAIRQRARRPLVAFGVCWFVGVLAPTTFVPVRDGLAEHRLYLAGAGLVLAVVSVAAGTLEWRRWIRAVAAVAIALLGVRTYARHTLWLDPLSLWRASVERAGSSWVAHREYAEVLQEAGLCDLARAEWQAAQALNPATEVRPGAGLRRCQPPR